MKRFLFFLILASSFLLLASNSLPVHAALPKNTITVLPQLTQIDLAKDGPEAPIYYTNSSQSTVELSFSIEDVRELEDRNPVGILDPKEASNYKYSLSSWVYLDRQNIILKPGETGQVQVTINSEKLAPGGHYGTVLAQIRQSDENSKAVKIRGVLAALLFVRANTGHEIEEAKVSSFNPQSQGLKFPSSFSFRFQNMGNVDLTPYGTITIEDGNGHMMARGVINEDSLITLPEAIRRYDVPLKSVQKFILPGRYKAVLSLHYGKTNKKIEVNSTFATQGSFDIVLFAAVLITVLILRFFLFKFNGFEYIVSKFFNLFKRSSGDRD